MVSGQLLLAVGEFSIPFSRPFASFRGSNPQPFPGLHPSLVCIAPLGRKRKGPAKIVPDPRVNHPLVWLDGRLIATILAHMNCFMISVKPRYSDLIFSGVKTVELRRVPPKVGAGDVIVVYTSSPIQQIQGAFTVAELKSGPAASLWEAIGTRAGTDRESFMEYFAGRNPAHAILIERAWRYPAPIGLSQLRQHPGGFHPPQNFLKVRDEQRAFYVKHHR